MVLVSFVPSVTLYAFIRRIMKDLYTTRKVAALLGVAVNTLFQWTRELGIPKYVYGNDRRIRWIARVDVERLQARLKAPVKL